jgi:Mn-dependent DtxR family transcriptional regulator
MSRGRTPDRIRVLSLLDGKEGLSSLQIKRALHFASSRYKEVRGELLRDGLVEKYVCRGGGLRLTGKGEKVAAQGLEPDREANEDVSRRSGGPADQSDATARSAQTISAAERDARICILGLLVERGDLSQRRIKQELSISDEMYDKVRAALVADGLVEQTGKAGGGGLKLAAKGEQRASDSGLVKPTGDVEGNDAAGAVEQVRRAAKGATLTLDLAKKFLGDREAVDLYEFTSITDNAAAALADELPDDDVLSLNGLTSVSDAAAAALAKRRRLGLSLNGLTSLSDAAVAALAGYEGWVLSLNGLTSVSDAKLAALAEHKGELSLNGLTSLSDAAAAALAPHEGGLKLNGLTSLSDAAAAVLAKHEESLSLNGLTSLSDAAAAALA